MTKKDLTFIDLGNDSKVEGLVNFEKLRMIAKEIRHICNMCSAKYVSLVCFILMLNIPAMQDNQLIKSYFCTKVISQYFVYIFSPVTTVVRLINVYQTMFPNW